MQNRWLVMSRCVILNPQGWSTTRTTHCDSGYDVTVAINSLADLNLPKMKTITPESNRLSCVCAAWCPYLLTPTEWKTWANNISGRRTPILPFEWRGPGTHCVTMEMSQWTIMELCDNCNNCTKFQFYTEKVFGDIPFFVILDHFTGMSTMWCHKSSNLHKSKSCINQQPRVLSK